MGLKFDNFSIALFSKFTSWQFYDLDVKMRQGGAHLLVEDSYFLNKKTMKVYFAEPGIQMSAGGKEVQFMMQISRTFNLTDKDILVRKANINIGCNVRLGGRSNHAQH